MPHAPASCLSHKAAASAIARELGRQQSQIELIARQDRPPCTYRSRSIPTNKYIEAMLASGVTWGANFSTRSRPSPLPRSRSNITSGRSGARLRPGASILTAIVSAHQRPPPPRWLSEIAAEVLRECGACAREAERKTERASEDGDIANVLASPVPLVE